MLVTLASNQTIAASSSATYTYSPDSVQKVLIRLEDADWEDAKVTVQIGSKTICNGVTVFGLAGLSGLQNAYPTNFSGTAGFVSLDFGSHVCTGNDNLYVTLQANGEVVGVDVSAIVDEPGQNFPVKLTEYSDNTFTSNNNLLAICYDASKTEMEEDFGNCEIRTSISSSAPVFCSAASYWNSQCADSGGASFYGILNIHQVPLKTTYNYTVDKVDRILTIEQMGTSRQQEAQARRSAQIAVSQAGK